MRLLGPVDIRVGRTVRAPAGTRRTAVLAALALNAGQTVSVDALIDIVWSGDEPATAANTLQSHISHLRGLFRTRGAIVATAPGYRLEVGDDATDLRSAERLIAEAARATQAQDRVTALRSALALWRSSPLRELGGIAWFDGQAERIERLRANAFSSLVDALLGVGEHAALVPELENLVCQHPFDEVLHGQLMLALYRSGRQADALAAYQRIRTRLYDELGLDPGRPLRELETTMLQQDPSLEPPAAPVITTTPARSSDVVPAQLPPALGRFVGRQAELRLLDEASTPERIDAAAVILAVSGPPGVGKTSLAVRWSHQVATSFPDGQLYINLRGFGPQATVMEPADALYALLQALGVAPQQIPESLSARVGLYRSVLATRRVLVLLDNAHDAEQVRALLPGSPGCAALVTSRSKLMPLVVTEGAVAVSVDVLSRGDALELLSQRLGHRRMTEEPDAVDEIVRWCAGLPLALATVAARAATEPAVSLAAIASDVEATTVHDTLAGGGGAAMSAVASWSYAVLGPEAGTRGADTGPDVPRTVGADDVRLKLGPVRQLSAGRRRCA